MKTQTLLERIDQVILSVPEKCGPYSALERIRNILVDAVMEDASAETIAPERPVWPDLETQISQREREAQEDDGA